MRFRLSAITSKSAAKLASAVCLASLAAGCSSGVTRFDHGLFTGSVPEPVENAPASAAPQRTAPAANASALAQPYPGDVSASAAPSVTYDRTYTGSIASSSPALAQSYPGSPQTVALAQPSRNYSSQQTAVVRQPLRRAPVVEPPVQDIELAPVPVVTQVVPTARPTSVAMTVPVPVQKIPTPYSATRRPVRTASYAPPRSAIIGSVVPPTDPIITGTTPTSAAARRSTHSADGWTTTGGTRVTVGHGETLYNLSRRYGVPAREIMKANNIADPSKVGAGQVVIIPTYVYSRKAPISAPDNNPKTRAARASTGYQGEARPDNVPVPAQAPNRQVAVLPTVPTAKPAAPSQSTTSTASPVRAANAGSTYTVQSGDSLSRIAARAGVTVSSLKAANGLTNSTIRVGQTLRIPNSRNDVDTVQTASVPPIPKSKQRSSTSVSAQVSRPATAVDARTPKTTGIDKLRWPARGQVMTTFGANDDGVRNDGIDISLPKGTPVKAAENGIVIYAGSGLKEYGKTVLVRHGNGLVSVYGHASELIVQRGDNVSRGQVVALSGMSGQASRPKLHFEIRKDAKPVDPLTYLE
ncbi:peptidoglycan DD-metalloendopeptidase family protein [Hoeflea sp. TYP-13]